MTGASRAPAGGERRSGAAWGGPAALGLASAGVLAGSLLASFRLGFADDLPTLVAVNGPRVLFAGGAGAALALAGALRLQEEREPPLRELGIFALSVGAAGGGFALAEAFGRGSTGPLAFAAGAVLGAAALLGVVRTLARPRRWTNPAAAAVLVVGIGGAALAGAYARARQDVVAPAVAWLLGDLSGATWTSGALLGVLAVALLVGAVRKLRGPSAAPAAWIAPVAFGVGVGAAGPLAFVGSLAPRCARALAGVASPAARVAVGTLAGAASVAAIDAVPRLLVGGYTLPFNVAAGMLAIPVFLGWNRSRLRREAGPGRVGFEIAELALISGLTLAAAALALTLARVIAVAT